MMRRGTDTSKRYCASFTLSGQLCAGGEYYGNSKPCSHYSGRKRQMGEKKGNAADLRSRERL